MNTSVRKVKIKGTGMYVPEKIRDNHWFEKLGSTDKWIFDNIGIKERRIAADGEYTSDLAMKAGLKAIENAGLKLEDIDMVIVATNSPDRRGPTTAPITITKMGLQNVPAFDMNNTCSSSIYAFATGSQFIASHMYEHVLVICAEVCSSFLNWEDRNSAFLGDGAGAVVLSPSDGEEGFLHFDLNANGLDKDIVHIKSGGSEMPITNKVIADRENFWYMNAKKVYNRATVLIPESISNSLQTLDLTVDDIAHIIPHQPSIRMLRTIADKIGVPWEKVHTNMDKYANTSSATVFILLDEVHRAGKLRVGENIIFTAIGAGMTWGSIVYKWG